MRATPLRVSAGDDQTATVNWKRTLAGVICSLGGMTFGYDLGALSGAAKSVAHDFVLSPALLGLTISIFIVGRCLCVGLRGPPGRQVGTAQPARVLCSSLRDLLRRPRLAHPHAMERGSSASVPIGNCGRRIRRRLSALPCGDCPTRPPRPFCRMVSVANWSWRSAGVCRERSPCAQHF